MSSKTVIETAIADDEAWQSRAFQCPDGLSRTVCLAPSVWDLVDALESNYGLDIQGLVGRCFQTASAWSRDFEGRDLHYDFTAWIEHEILVAYHKHVLMPRDNIANDSWKCPYWEARSLFLGVANPFDPS